MQLQRGGGGVPIFKITPDVYTRYETNWQVIVAAVKNEEDLDYFEDKVFFLCKIMV